MELKIFVTTFMFIFGTIFGSFFNVVGWRLPKGLSLVKPGSFCPKCKHKLKWYELIPLFSFLIQGGKCRKCKAPIPKFYFIIELTTGILFALSYWIFGFSFECALSILISSFFVIVVVSDSNYLIIPDEVTIFFSIAIILIRLIMNGPLDAFWHLIYGVVAFFIMYGLMLLGLGIGLSLFTIFLSSFIALPLSLLLYAKNKDSVIPYGPFLLIATLIIVVFQLDLSIILGLSI